MLKYVDFWYALKTTKHAQTILKGISMETTKARAVLRKKNNNYAARQFSWLALQLFVIICLQIHFNLSQTIILVHDSVQRKIGLIWSYVH